MSGIRLAENLGNGFNLMDTNHDLLSDLIKASTGRVTLG